MAEGNEDAMEQFLNTSFEPVTDAIIIPPIQANNFEVHPTFLQLFQSNQFSGEDDHDPNLHVSGFLELCRLHKHNGVSTDAIRLILFPFTLKGKAKEWLRNEPERSITSWDDLREIDHFSQNDGESFGAAWKRFKGLLTACPQYALQAGDKVRLFYHGICPADRKFLNAAVNGSFVNKDPAASLQLIEELAAEENEDVPSSKRGILQVDRLDILLTGQQSL
ncbi:uncharacterized protein LOC133304066 [Gastrolobium bilobum]|uniref:uncharacterized protein LOC133304066 n=1 Tax=Gastrolobium bilobum TaxID=150636 RepID=UPI002AB097F5|nr:uncharacterized protein LOC133304066 [Gastrolobium bilobum]